MLMMSRVVAGAIYTLLVLQQSSGPTPKTPSATTPAFDVATIRPMGNGGGISGFYSAPRGKVTVGGSVMTILSVAYGVPSFQIAGVPQEFAHAAYSITALPPEGSPSRTIAQSHIYPTEEQLHMLQNLLADRFALKLHREVTEGPVFYLEKSGKALHLDPPKHPEMDAKGAIVVRSGVGMTGEAFGQNISMEKFAQTLSRTLQTPVLDHTGIAGNYDFNVGASEANQDGTDATASALEQLGLKLKAGKGPVEKIVIDNISKPTEN